MPSIINVVRDRQRLRVPVEFEKVEDEISCLLFTNISSKNVDLIFCFCLLIIGRKASTKVC
jgi:hypothetical protein